MDTCSASVPVLMPYFSSFCVKANSDPEVVFLALWRLGVHAQWRSVHSRSFRFPCLHLEFGQYVMSPLYLAVPVRCLVCGAMLGSTMDTCSASPGWVLEVFTIFYVIGWTRLLRSILAMLRLLVCCPWKSVHYLYEPPVFSPFSTVDILR